MLLRFRRHCFVRFILLAFSLLACDGKIVFALQDPVPVAKPNGLRLGSASERSKPTRPLIEVGQTPALSKPESMLIIGSPGTLLAGPNEMVAHEKEEDEIARASALAMKIAVATMSHATPFFWWMAGPTNHLVVEKKEEPELLEMNEPWVADQERVEDMAEIGIGEPPRMMRVDEEDLREESVASVEKTPDALPRRPTPRNVRIPFDQDSEGTDQEDAKPAFPKKLMTRDTDSQRDQEEPRLDPRKSGTDRDQQGVDALLASKPGTRRREVRIDDPSNEGVKVAPIVQSKSTDPVLAKRLQRTEACVAYYLNNPESTSVRSPWAVMHALLAYGGDYELIHGQGRVNAIGWMCHNGTCRTQRMFTPAGKGFTPNVGGGVQGHEGQFLAILAQSNVPLNYPIQIGSSKFTVEDLVRYEMANCKEKSELTFKLIGLSYYLDSNKQWRANDGKQWSIAKLIQEELAQPIIGAACGGVHRLMGFSFSVRQRQLQGQPINGQYARAAKFVHDYIDYTWQLQNPDGSFSTSWYEGRANEPKDERKVQTSGHMLEWLLYTLPDEEIKNPRVGKAIDFLLSRIYDQRNEKWPIGPRGHATRAIALYEARTKEILGATSQNVPIHSAAKSAPAAVRK